ncbi:MAG: FlgD immunoglobulin-like domain containing protein, partial [bacterium]
STGDSQAVVVNFAPVSSGSKQANVRIASNDPTANPFDVNLTGIGKIADPVSGIGDPKTLLPEQIRLHANYPNPFNAGTVIEYELPAVSEVRLLIYNNLGQLIRTLVDETQSAGFKKIVWDGKNQKGKRVVSGNYYYQLEGNRKKIVRRMILQK